MSGSLFNACLGSLLTLDENGSSMDSQWIRNGAISHGDVLPLLKRYVDHALRYLATTII